MPGAFVQSWGNSSTGASATSLTVTLSPSPSANTLLFATAAVVGGGMGAPPAGWTQVTEADDIVGTHYYKVADGTETEVTFAWTDSVNDYCALVSEYSGLAATSPLEDEDNTDYREGPNNSITPGPVTPLTANGMAISGLIILDERLWGVAETSVNNSYTIDGFESQGGNNRAVHHASLAYASTAAQSVTWSTTSLSASADNKKAWIGVFKEPGAGGGGGGVALAIEGLTVANSLDAPALTQHNVLAVDALTVANGLDEVALTQHNVLAVDDISVANSLDEARLGVILIVEGLTVANSVDVVALIQHHILSVDPLTVVNTLDEVSLSSGGTPIVVEGLDVANTLDLASLTQHNVLAVDALAVANLLDEVNFIEAIVPLERVIIVQGDDRVIVVRADDRDITVQGDDRNITIQ